MSQFSIATDSGGVSLVEGAHAAEPFASAAGAASAPLTSDFSKQSTEEGAVAVRPWAAHQMVTQAWSHTRSTRNGGRVREGREK
jgi:hypothetical protein